jgi:hypothetical protein
MHACHINMLTTRCVSIVYHSIYLPPFYTSQEQMMALHVAVAFASATLEAARAAFNSALVPVDETSAAQQAVSAAELLMVQAARRTHRAAQLAALLAANQQLPHHCLQVKGQDAAAASDDDDNDDEVTSSWKQS